MKERLAFDWFRLQEADRLERRALRQARAARWLALAGSAGGVLGGGTFLASFAMLVLLQTGHGTLPWVAEHAVDVFLAGVVGGILSCATLMASITPADQAAQQAKQATQLRAEHQRHAASRP